MKLTVPGETTSESVVKVKDTGVVVKENSYRELPYLAGRD
jgi:hypothetical protein